MNQIIVVMREIGKHWLPVDLEKGQYAATNIVLNDAVFKRNRSISFLANQVITLFHELQHARQITMVRSGLNNKDSLQYAREFALLELANQNENLGFLGDFYNENHDLFKIENNANSTSIAKFIEMIQNSGIIPEEYIEAKSNLYKTNMKYSLNEEFEEQIDDMIAPYISCELIKAYPALQKEYNMDGTRKTARQLVTDLKAGLDKLLSNQDLDEYSKREQTRDCKEMYYELIINAINRENMSLVEKTELNDEYSPYGNLSLDIQNYFESQIKKISEAQHSLSSQERVKIIKYYEGKIDLLKDEWAFVLTEEEQQKAQKEMNILEHEENDYNHPKGTPRKFDTDPGSPTKWISEIDGIYKIIYCSDITLAEYNDEIKKVKNQVRDNTITRGEEQERH